MFPKWLARTIKLPKPSAFRDSGIAERQLAFDLTAQAVRKPSPDEIDLLISDVVAKYQPDLELPKIRVSGRMRRTLGSYQPANKQISISSRLLTLADQDEVREVVLHEIAHAIVHKRFGKEASAHGKEFRSVCDELGVKPRRHIDVDIKNWQPRLRYLSKCGHCKSLIVRKKRVRSVRCQCGEKVYPPSWKTIAPASESSDAEWVLV
jgi:SprT protein